MLALAASGRLALAEIADRSDAGFTVKYSTAIAAPPEFAFSKIIDIAKWWDSGHTYSGDARNLSIEAKPGGCHDQRVFETRNSGELAVDRTGPRLRHTHGG